MTHGRFGCDGTGAPGGRGGGSVTGEHGIGVEKIEFMRQMFTADDLDVMARLRTAFNPLNNLSPQKMLPTSAGCGAEQKHLHVAQERPARRAAESSERSEDLGGRASIEIQAGDMLTIETPGGGGWGIPAK